MKTNYDECIAGCFIISERKRLMRVITFYEMLIRLSRLLPIDKWREKLDERLNFRIRLLVIGYQQVGKWRIRIEAPDDLKGSINE